MRDFLARTQRRRKRVSRLIAGVVEEDIFPGAWRGIETLAMAARGDAQPLRPLSGGVRKAATMADVFKISRAWENRLRSAAVVYNRTSY